MTSLIPQSFELGTNPLVSLTDEDFGKALDEWRVQPHVIGDPTAKIFAVMFLNEAERRWRPQ